MKNLLTNSITTSVGFPVKSGTLDFLQNASTEMLIAIARSIVGKGYSASTPYALYGCNNTGSGSSYVIQEGAILWNGVLYLVPAVSFTLTGGNSVYVIGSTTYVTSAVADPVTFTDGVTRNVHSDTKMSVYQSAFAPSPSAGFAYSGLKYLNQTIQESQTLTLSANYLTYSGATPKVRLTSNIVSFSGAILCDTGSAPIQTIFTLPTDFRPSYGKVFSVRITDFGGNYKDAYLSINTAGVFQVSNATSGTIVSYCIPLDGLSFNI